MGLGILAIIFLIASFILAVIKNELQSPSLWALWAIGAALILGAVRI